MFFFESWFHSSFCQSDFFLQPFKFAIRLYRTHIIHGTGIFTYMDSVDFDGTCG